MALPHSILINLYIKVGLKISSPTSPVKYCFCPKDFCSYVWWVWGGGGGGANKKG